MTTPSQSPYIIIGAGIHGLSTAYHLALRLRATGKGDGHDIIILDKSVTQSHHSTARPFRIPKSGFPYIANTGTACWPLTGANALTTCRC